jgi:eukaryotic-like serine/threonine-protein kinase
MSRDMDRRCDLFAIGSMLWEAAAGSRLWKGLPEVEVLMRLADGQIPSPISVNPDVHPKLEAICMKALAFDRENRYATASELQNELEALIEELGGMTSRDVGRYVSTLFSNRRKEVKAFIDGKLREFRSQVRAPALSGEVEIEVVYEDATAATAEVAPAVQVAPFQQAPAKNRKVLVGSAAILGVAALLGIFASRSETPLPSPTPTLAQNPPVVAAPPPVPAPTMITRVALKASPISARFFLDDAPLADNPWSGELPADGALHRVRAEAPGFVPVTELVKVEGPSISISLTLNVKPVLAGTWKAPAPDPNVPQPVSVVAPAPPPSPPSLPSLPSGRPKVDRDDPWKQ